MKIEESGKNLLTVIWTSLHTITDPIARVVFTVSETLHPVGGALLCLSKILEPAGETLPAGLVVMRITGFLQELCDVGSFKLLGWMLKITGTWNCLNHTSLNCTQLCANRWRSKSSMASMTSISCVAFISLKSLFQSRSIDTVKVKAYYSRFRSVALVKSHMWIRNKCSLNVKLKIGPWWFTHVLLHQKPQ